VLIPVALFYLLLDWDSFVRLRAATGAAAPAPGVDSFTDEADQVLGQYLRGQLLVMLTMAVFYSIGLALFGLDLALPIGVFTGLAMFVPYLGFGIGLVLALLAGPAAVRLAKAFVMVAVVYGAGQLVEGFYFTPRLVGERIGLHPLAVIFALLAFGAAVRLRRRAGRAAGQRRAAGGDPPRAHRLPGQPAVPGMKQLTLPIGLARRPRWPASAPAERAALEAPAAVGRQPDALAGAHLPLGPARPAARPTCCKAVQEACASRAPASAGWTPRCWSRPSSTSAGPWC
jgi:hypothetical protein